MLNIRQRYHRIVTRGSSGYKGDNLADQFLIQGTAEAIVISGIYNRITLTEDLNGQVGSMELKQKLI